jgi:archaeal type IV pilus assembly protein PilA
MNIGKSIRKFRRNMHAISPVIATLLMIAIAVVASLVTYAWVMGYMNFTTEKTGKAILIQSVSNVTTTTIANNKLTLYVQNVGDSAVIFNDQSVFVNGVQIAPTPSLGASGTTIAAGSTTTIVVPYSPSGAVVPVSFTVDLKVTTTDGTFSTMTKTFP